MHDIDAVTERLLIRPWAESDGWWYVGAVDEEILRWTREPEDLDLARWVASLGDLDDKTRTAAVTERASGTLLGNVGVRLHADVVELFYWIESSARGHGYATEALGGLVEWVEGQYPKKPMELHMHPDNARSVRVAEKAGFSFHGYEESCETCADDEGRVAVYRRTARH